MEGVIWHLHPQRKQGLIRGNDGQDLPFRFSDLMGTETESEALSIGHKVRYRIQLGWFSARAVEVRPLPEAQSQRRG